MEPSEVQAILQADLPGCEVSVNGDGRHFDILVVGDVFAGQRAIKRQQMVYAILNDHIAAGAIHAVNMKTFTSDEWAARQ